MEVKLLSQDHELNQLCPVLLQLRPQYDEASLLQQIQKQLQQGYQLAWVESGGQILCVAGFVIADKLAWGKHLYIDDLVTHELARSRGAGHTLLEWLKRYARQSGCGQLHLDSGVQRFSAHRFYFREGLTISSHHFAIAL